MNRKFIALGATLVLAAGLGVTPAVAGTPTTHTVKVAVKAGGACTKVGAKATISKVAYVCTKNTKTKKLTWVKVVAKKKVLALSAECTAMKVSNDKTQQMYATALANIATMESQIAAFETSAASVTGSSGDSLRAQAEALRAKVNPLKQMVLALGPAVSNAAAQFKLFC